MVKQTEKRLGLGGSTPSVRGKNQRKKQQLRERLKRHHAKKKMQIPTPLNLGDADFPLRDEFLVQWRARFDSEEHRNDILKYIQDNMTENEHESYANLMADTQYRWMNALLLWRKVRRRQMFGPLGEGKKVRTWDAIETFCEAFKGDEKSLNACYEDHYGFCRENDSPNSAVLEMFATQMARITKAMPALLQYFQVFVFSAELPGGDAEGGATRRVIQYSLQMGGHGGNFTVQTYIPCSIEGQDEHMVDGVAFVYKDVDATQPPCCVQLTSRKQLEDLPLDDGGQEFIFGNIHTTSQLWSLLQAVHPTNKWAKTQIESEHLGGGRMRLLRPVIAEAADPVAVGGEEEVPMKKDEKEPRKPTVAEKLGKAFGSMFGGQALAKQMRSLAKELRGKEKKSHPTIHEADSTSGSESESESSAEEEWSSCSSNRGGSDTGDSDQGLVGDGDGGEAAAEGHGDYEWWEPLDPDGAAMPAWALAKHRAMYGGLLMKDGSLVKEDGKEKGGEVSGHVEANDRGEATPKKRRVGDREAELTSADIFDASGTEKLGELRLQRKENNFIICCDRCRLRISKRFTKWEGRGYRPQGRPVGGAVALLQRGCPGTPTEHKDLWAMLAHSERRFGRDQANRQEDMRPFLDEERDVISDEEDDSEPEMPP